MRREELKKLAIDIVEGRVFGTWNISSEEKNLIPMIFLPLNFIDERQFRRLKSRKIVHAYEHLDRAGPRTVNGYPIFFSCKFLTRKDWKRVVRYIRRYKRMRERFLKEV